MPPHGKKHGHYHRHHHHQEGQSGQLPSNSSFDLAQSFDSTTAVAPGSNTIEFSTTLSSRPVQTLQPAETPVSIQPHQPITLVEAFTQPLPLLDKIVQTVCLAIFIALIILTLVYGRRLPRRRHYWFHRN